VTALAIENHNIATPESRAAMVLGIVPMFLLISLFAGGMYVAIDVMSGERERGSLEPLLANPVSPLELVLGKLGAVWLFAWATSILALTGFAVVLNRATLDVPGMRIGLSAGGVVSMIAVLTPLSLLAAAGLLLVASMSRTFKEAQTSAQFLNFLPMMPGIIMLASPYKAQLWMMSVPLLSHQLLLEQLLKGETLAILDLSLATAASLALTVAVIGVTVWRYDRQRVLFGAG
jgi:sodium transport system permease protein